MSNDQNQFNAGRNGMSGDLYNQSYQAGRTVRMLEQLPGASTEPVSGGASDVEKLFEHGVSGFVHTIVLFCLGLKAVGAAMSASSGGTALWILSGTGLAIYFLSRAMRVTAYRLVVRLAVWGSLCASILSPQFRTVAFATIEWIAPVVAAYRGTV